MRSWIYVETSLNAYPDDKLHGKRGGHVLWSICIIENLEEVLSLPSLHEVSTRTQLLR